MKDTKIKNFNQELSIIEKFESFKNKKIIIENCNGKSFITKSKKEFQLFYDGVFNYKLDKKINVKIDNVDFTFQSIDFKEATDDRLAKIAAQYTFDIDKVYKGNISKVTLFKMFFLIILKEKIFSTQN